jgi:superfamily II DNA/RNA helicase
VKELAYQIQQEIERLGKYLKNIRSAYFFGGQPFSENRRTLAGNGKGKDGMPHIIVGTPGRILHLIREGVLKLDNLKYFVLDECDKLVEELGTAYKY